MRSLRQLKTTAGKDLPKWPASVRASWDAKPSKTFVKGVACEMPSTSIFANQLVTRLTLRDTELTAKQALLSTYRHTTAKR